MQDKKLRIVATGDSMTDTAGPGMTELAKRLDRTFPGRFFEIINQGVGGTRVGYGLWRLRNPYEFQGKCNPPLLSLNPDIVLLESFAYNNGSEGLNGEGLQHFRKCHIEMVNIIRNETDAKIIFVITISPDTEHFLESVPNFVYTPVSIRRWMAQDRIRYLEEAESIANDLHLPTANVYRATLAAKAKGIPLGTFINQEDWIHPGPAGHELTADVIIETMKLHNIVSTCD